MSELIIKPRKAGKTYNAILESERTGATIICATAQEVKIVTTLAQRMNKKIPKPLECMDEDYKSKMRGRVSAVIVDNAEWVLGRLLGKPVYAITLTDEGKSHLCFCDVGKGIKRTSPVGYRFCPTCGRELIGEVGKEIKDENFFIEANQEPEDKVAMLTKRKMR